MKARESGWAIHTLGWNPVLGAFCEGGGLNPPLDNHPTRIQVGFTLFEFLGIITWGDAQSHSTLEEILGRCKNFPKSLFTASRHDRLRIGKTRHALTNVKSMQSEQSYVDIQFIPD